MVRGRRFLRPPWTAGLCSVIRKMMSISRSSLGQNQQMTPAQIATQLHGAVDAVLPLFNGVDEAQTLRRSRPDGWCARQILGHLIDSASNNHRRFVLGQSSDVARHDGYNQDNWVSRQRYENMPWADLVAL